MSDERRASADVEGDDGAVHLGEHGYDPARPWAFFGLARVKWPDESSDSLLLRVVRLICLGSRHHRHSPVLVGEAREYAHTKPWGNPLPDGVEPFCEWYLEPDESTGGCIRHIGEDRKVVPESVIKAIEGDILTGRRQRELTHIPGKKEKIFRCTECSLNVRTTADGWITGLHVAVRNVEPNLARGDLGAPVWDLPVRVLEMPRPRRTGSIKRMR